MIIKKQNKTAEYEARLEKLNKTIKNKNEFLQKKRIERISTTLVAKSVGRGKKSTVKGKQVCTPEESIVKGKHVLVTGQTRVYYNVPTTPLAHWPFWQQNAEQLEVSPEVILMGWPKPQVS